MPVKMQHVAKGPRPQFSENAEVDRVIAMVLALAGEVAVLREQLETVVGLAAARGMLTREEVRRYAPPAAEAAERDQWRQDFIRRVLYVLEAEAESGRGPAAP
jgi:hypothetical protein